MTPRRATAGELRADEDLITAIRAAVGTHARKHGWAAFADVSQYLDRRHGVTASAYGFAKLHQLIASTDLFEVDRPGKGQPPRVREKQGSTARGARAVSAPAAVVTAAFRADEALFERVASAVRQHAADDGWSDLGAVARVLAAPPAFEVAAYGCASLPDLLSRTGRFTVRKVSPGPHQKKIHRVRVAPRTRRGPAAQLSTSAPPLASRADETPWPGTVPALRLAPGGMPDGPADAVQAPLMTTRARAEEPLEPLGSAVIGEGHSPEEPPVRDTPARPPRAADDGECGDAGDDIDWWEERLEALGRASVEDRWLPDSPDAGPPPEWAAPGERRSEDGGYAFTPLWEWGDQGVATRREWCDDPLASMGSGSASENVEDPDF